MIRALFLVPLLCWPIAAATPRIRVRVGVVLGAIAVAEMLVSLGWVLRSGTMTVMVLLVVLNCVAVVWGLMSDRAQDAENPAVRRIGRKLVIWYCVLSVLGALAVVGVMKGQRASVPPSDALLPLPEGLVLLENQDRGCGGNSSTICLRAFEIGSSGNVSAEDVSDRVRRHLESAHNWSLYRGRGGDWSGCRDEGWVLDRNNRCVSVFDRSGHTVVWFESVAYN
ncbi:hypothetical protein ABZV58_29720 [Nocardia sp. NPDC004654]|uniref:hypothetical protein n=1 Tax=Nocardia sp. NPDC004654 TaxID=3154776 RepID=UPI0033B6CDCC